MDVSFQTKGLAAVCNSEQRLAERWGPDLGRIVGRRLLDLAASTAATIDQIPTARVRRRNTGETTVTFAEAIVIRGRLERPRPADEDRFVIMSVEVHGRGSR
jgi:hypothetical protein